MLTLLKKRGKKEMGGKKLRNDDDAMSLATIEYECQYLTMFLHDTGYMKMNDRLYICVFMVLATIENELQPVTLYLHVTCYH